MTGPDIKPELQDAPGSEAFFSLPPPEPWRLGHLMGLIVLVALFFWLCLLFGKFLVFALVVTAIAAVFFGGSVWARRRAAGRDALLSIMAIAAEKGMPLAPAVAAFASQYGGRTRRRIFRLAMSLNSGASLSESLMMARGLLSNDAVFLARVGEEAGVLPAALRAGVITRASVQPALASIAARIAYILAILFVMQSIMGFLLYYIMPRFAAIFADFGIPLPNATTLVIDVTHGIMDYAPVAALILLAELILLVFLPLKILGWFSLDLPLVDRIFRRRHTALILRALSLVVGQGRPIGLGMNALARNYPTGWVRRRLVSVDMDVRRGEDWCVSLWRQGLIRESDGALLASAQASGNLAWALRELADTSDRRSLVRLQAAVQMLFPLVILMLGLLVALVALAYFGPLIELINRLSG